MRRHLLPLLLISLILAGPASAVTHHVGKDGSANVYELQTAVHEAGAGDTVLVHPGNYVGTILYIYKKDIVLKSTDGPEKTILDADKGQFAIRCREGGTEGLIEGFTIRNGFSKTRGGGVFLGAGSGFTIRGNIFEDCESPWGGAVYVGPNTSAKIENNLFRSNISSTNGGAIYGQHCELVIRNNTFTGNNAEEPGSAIGLYSAVATIENNLFVSQLGTAAIYILNDKVEATLNCNGFWKNSGENVASYKDVKVPKDPSALEADPLFADEKLCRLSAKSPYKERPCGTVGWEY